MNLKKIKTKKNIDLGPLTTLGIGGQAQYLFFVKNKNKLSMFLNELGGQFYILGNGSNLLIKDNLIKKPIVKLTGDFKLIRQKEGILEVGASTLLSFLIKYCINKNLSGLEGLAGIPATIGGMLSSSASSFGSSIFDYLQKVEVMEKETGIIQEIKKSEIEYGYRYSNLCDKVILKAYFKFFKNGGKIKQKIKNIIQKRIVLQDFSFPNCGSIFKNPYPQTAGALIEKVGLKGIRKGDVKVSNKHANFILNLGNGSYQDIDYLIQHIKDTVFRKEGIVLEEEIQRWN